jgi:hypothetical protein
MPESLTQDLRSRFVHSAGGVRTHGAATGSRAGPRRTAEETPRWHPPRRAPCSAGGVHACLGVVVKGTAESIHPRTALMVGVRRWMSRRAFRSRSPCCTVRTAGATCRYLRLCHQHTSSERPSFLHSQCRTRESIHCRSGSRDTTYSTRVSHLRRY